MTKASTCLVCGEDNAPSARTCSLCGLDPGAAPPGGDGVGESLGRAWRQLRARRQELNTASAKRERDLAHLEALMTKRARLLDLRVAEFEKRSMEVRVREGRTVAREDRPPAEPDLAPIETAGRVPTGVRGLDEALGGGLPRGYVVIVEGAPGTMKTSLGLWILAHNAGGGRRGLYVTCEENAGSLVRQALALGLSLETLKEGLRILDARTLKPTGKKGWLASLKDAVASARADGGVDLLVLDSLDAVGVLAKFEDHRQELFRLFEWLRSLDATTLVVAERGDYVLRGTVLQLRHEENFLADGVLHLRMHPISDVELQRRLRIVKMRGTKHEMGYLALHAARGEFEVARALGG